MPGFDGAGPLGFGCGTGWGLGPCGAGMAWGQRRGFGRGLGKRRFWGSRPPLTRKEETDILTDEAQLLEDELGAVKERLSDLKAKK